MGARRIDQMEAVGGLQSPTRPPRGERAGSSAESGLNAGRHAGNRTLERFRAAGGTMVFPAGGC